ncbi:protein translocase subunit SecF [Patescibacteria group bacterium]|nr:protein translocase subunit SecF [Patescibacteria group bacterium]
MPDFMRYKLIFFLVSALVLIPGLVSLVLWGLKPAIDFTGGTMWELNFKEDVEVTQTLIEEHIKETDLTLTSVQKTGPQSYLIKMSPLGETDKDSLKSSLKDTLGEFTEVSFETVGPTLGRELLVKTMIAVVLAAGFILVYVAWRFKDKMYGICAILAMFHDTLIVLGIFSLLGHFLLVEVDTLFVTAVLTVLSFSVHDTVVVYDRIRELIKLYPRIEFVEIINRAVADTLTRSVNNSLTIIFMLLALLFLGGETIRWFVVALLVGTIAGTYSSTFTAAPLLVIWYNRVK